MCVGHMLLSTLPRKMPLNGKKKKGGMFDIYTHMGNKTGDISMRGSSRMSRCTVGSL